MAPKTVNVLLSSFPGLSLPSTLSISLPPTSTIADLTETIVSYLPSKLRDSGATLTLTTLSNKQLFASSDRVTSLVDNQDVQSAFLPLRLSAPLRGGKGGFGSQLRAAGGRMSSRRKGNQGENNDSNRNLDGRRLRTVKEAKALAEHLALKPDMEKKRKEARRKKLEMAIEAAERQQAELKKGGGKNKLDGAWVEDREDAERKTREAVQRAMEEGLWKDNLAGEMVGGSGSSASEGSSGSRSGSAASASPDGDSDMEDIQKANNPELSTTKSAPAPARRFFGFDDDDDDDDELLSDEDDEINDKQDDVKGKGKAKA